MSVTVRIPTILRPYTDNSSVVQVEGHDVAAVVAALDATYPGVAARILEDDGTLRRFVNIYVDNDDVRFGDLLATPTPDGSEVSVIPAVAGG